MNQFIYLSSCDTCQRIIKEVNLPKNIVLRDIKKTPLNPNELKLFKDITGTFRSLLNNRAQKLKNIDKSTLSEEKIFLLLNKHYSYLKRPILHFNGQLLIGNSKKNVEAIKNIF
tara:strand:+ start:4414 stop:4755 length:342 start_codon:yes stop_codon:yes gene_type:complete